MIGLFSTILNGALLFLMCYFLNVYNNSSLYSIGSIMSIIVFGGIFLSLSRIIKLSNSKLVIWKPLWFLGRNRFDISEISKVKLKKVYGVTYSMTEIEIIDKENFKVAVVITNWFGFEKNRLIKKMTKLGVETEIIND